MGKAYDKVMESRKELTKQLLAEMEHGKLVWVQGWDNTGKRPYNPVTDAVYKGGNRFRLMLASYFQHYSDNRWVTFAQAKEKGWTVKKGEKGMSHFITEHIAPFYERRWGGFLRDFKQNRII